MLAEGDSDSLRPVNMNAMTCLPHPALLEARKHFHTAYRPVDGQWQVGDDCQPDDDLASCRRRCGRWEQDWRLRAVTGVNATAGR